MGRKLVTGDGAPRRARGDAQLAQRTSDGPRLKLLPAGSSLPPPSGAAPAARAAGIATDPGEASALRAQALLALENYIELRVRYLRDKSTVKAVIPSPGSTAEAPVFGTCGERPVAVLFEADVLTDAFLAATAIRVREQGVKLLFESNHPGADPAATAAALDRLGLWSSDTADSLWLPQAGDPPGNDARRARIAERYCIAAIVGDRVADFSDLFASPGAAASRPLAALWGAGWFLVPPNR